MRKFLAVASAVVLFQAASMAQAADISFGINVGGPPIVISQPPDFLYPPELGFGVAVGVPYDMFYSGGIYYVYRGGGWYSTPSYGGSWSRMQPRQLPPELRRYKIARIHQYRDREYRGFVRDRDHYRGRAFHPGREAREDHREMKEQRREDHQEMRDLRKDHKEERKEERKDRKEDRKEERREERHDR
jgi:hypothetical protein